MFHLFMNNAFYPAGGMADYAGSFATLEDAKTAFITEDAYQYTWAHIAQVIDGHLEVVAAYGEHQRDKVIDGIERGQEWRDLI